MVIVLKESTKERRSLCTVCLTGIALITAETSVRELPVNDAIKSATENDSEIVQYLVLHIVDMPLYVRIRT